MKRNAWKELALGAAGVLLLAGCGAPVQSGSNLVGGEDVFTFTRENFPRIDGSTSTGLWHRQFAACCWTKAGRMWPI